MPLKGGVIFGDGIEADYLVFNWGMRAQFSIAPHKLKLVQPMEVPLPKIDTMYNRSNEALKPGLRYS